MRLRVEGEQSLLILDPRLLSLSPDENAPRQA